MPKAGKGLLGRTEDLTDDTMEEVMAKRGGYCVVWHSVTTGKRSRVVGCFRKKTEAEQTARERNRLESMGGWYSLHRKSVVQMWQNRGDPFDFEAFHGVGRKRCK